MPKSHQKKAASSPGVSRLVNDPSVVNNTRENHPHYRHFRRNNNAYHVNNNIVNSSRYHNKRGKQSKKSIFKTLWHHSVHGGYRGNKVFAPEFNQFTICLLWKLDNYFILIIHYSFTLVFIYRSEGWAKFNPQSVMGNVWSNNSGINTPGFRNQNKEAWAEALERKNIEFVN